MAKLLVFHINSQVLDDTKALKSEKDLINLVKSPFIIYFSPLFFSEQYTVEQHVQYRR